MIAAIISTSAIFAPTPPSGTPLASLPLTAVEITHRISPMKNTVIAGTATLRSHGWRQTFSIQGT